MLLARFTSEYCSAPLFFNIKEETSEILSKLRTNSNIVFAAIYDNKGKLYDSYNPKSEDIPENISFYKFDSVMVDYNSNSPFTTNVIAKQSITYQEINYGTTVIKLSMLQTEYLIRRNIRSAAIISFLMLIIAFFLGHFFQKIITNPILELAKVSDGIKRSTNYSVRLKKKNNDEIGLLYDSFNNMLEQIELRDKKRDYTEKKLEEAKEQAENADKLKSAFLANMSHEIRTPMNSIIGFAGLLADNRLKEDERLEYVDLINSSCNTLLHLIDDILDISKIEAGQTIIINQKCNIAAIINELYLSFKEINAQANNYKVDLRVSIPDDYTNLVLNTDEIRLKQVLSNLISNAIKFTNEGSIELGLTMVEQFNSLENKKFVKLYVKDTGIGIDKKTQEQIFDRFTKIEPDNNKLYRGAGLGLTISKKLVELMEGKLWVESTPGKGSTFYFTIPVPIEAITEEIFHSGAGLKSTPLILKGKNILIVEDDLANYELLKALLRRTEANIDWAQNGVDAIEFCKLKMPDIIFMDIKMPEMDGYETLTNLRKMNITAPIIAQTAYARIEDENKILEYGFNGYLSKPIEKTKLNHLIQKIYFEEQSSK